MKVKSNNFPIFLLISFFSLAGMVSCKIGREGKSSKAQNSDSIAVIVSNVNGTGRSVELEMVKGKANNHPTFAIWIEDTAGKYIQTLFVTRAYGQGIFEHGDNSGGNWKPGEVNRPAALPYWTHKRGTTDENGSLVPTPRNKVPDAYSGATPPGSFRLISRTDQLLAGTVRLMMEINQAWDWNEYWTNNLYPDDLDYKASCQPAVVYSALINFDKPGEKYNMKPVGHSHYSGKTGELYSDLSTITTALHIAETITVTVK